MSKTHGRIVPPRSSHTLLAGEKPAPSNKIPAVWLGRIFTTYSDILENERQGMAEVRMLSEQNIRRTRVKAGDTIILSAPEAIRLAQSGDGEIVQVVGEVPLLRSDEPEKIFQATEQPRKKNWSAAVPA